VKKILFLLCLLVFALKLCAQNEDINLEEFAERLFQIQDQELNYEDIYESLLLLYTNKLDLNSVDPETLASLYILSPIQLSSFYEYRDQMGTFLSINELQAIPNFDITTIKHLRPFITVDKNSNQNQPFLRRIIDEENNYLLLRYERRLEKQLGYQDATPFDSTFIKNELGEITDTTTHIPRRYKGSPDKIYGRFRTSRKDDFSIGFTFEKDAGEKFEFNHQQNGFDFYSYHLVLENKLGFEKIAFGDFQIQAGQGMVFGAGFNAGKGAETINSVKRNTLGLRPYTSVLENGFFRGIGFTKNVGKVDITGFVSKDRRDGRIFSDTLHSGLSEFVNSIQVSGFHRTEDELAQKNQLTETATGGFIKYQPSRKLKMGLSCLISQYGLPLRRNPSNYNQFEFRGTRNAINSIFFDYSWQNFQFFGEAAQSISGGRGLIGGFMTSLSPIIDFSWLLRKYQKDFHSFYGNAFSEGSRIINEKGTYWGIRIKPNSKHSINFYYDYFAFPWLKFQAEAPSEGYEWLGRYTYKPSKTVTIYVQGREQLRQITSANEGDNLNILIDQKRRNYFFNIDYTPSSRLQLRTKVQTSNQLEGKEFTKGFTIIQDINFKLWKINFYTRTALFDTDNFDNAQYVYENDVLFAFSIPAYSGVGVRNYFMIKYDPMKNLSLWVRYSQTNFRDRSSTGSGLELSNSSLRSEVKVMIRKKF